METILFQGDSITDAGRAGDNARGRGYVNLAAGHIMLDYPGRFQVLNRGIGMQRITDLYARIKADIINLKPDYLTILVGFNDVWLDIFGDNGVSDEKFRRIYEMFIVEILAACPGVKIYILEPYALPGRVSNEAWDELMKELPLRARSARAVAEKFGLPFIPLQEKFDQLCRIAPADTWLEDGVHPTVAGHEMIAREIIRVMEKDF